MSLGGSTVFAGRDLFDTAVDVMLEHGIVPVISAGNAGPSSLTVGSPGSVAERHHRRRRQPAHNERILRRSQYGAATGSLPSVHGRADRVLQLAWAERRRPAGSRRDVERLRELRAGVWLRPPSHQLASGTSFASPSVAGVAAVLRQRFPAATARQIRNAIIASANPGVLADGSTALDQGPAMSMPARPRRCSRPAPCRTPAGPGAYNKSVKVNIEKSTTWTCATARAVRRSPASSRASATTSCTGSIPNTSQVIVTLSGVTPALPPAQQNQLFGDDILLTVHTAKTSAIGEGDYPVFEFSPVGGTFVSTNPRNGHHADHRQRRLDERR